MNTLSFSESGHSSLGLEALSGYEIAEPDEFGAQMYWLAPIFLILITGCGGGLTAAQKAEYDQLGERKSALQAELSGVQASGRKAYNQLSAAEKKHKAVAGSALACGLSLKGQAIGPLPFRHKPKYRVRFVSGKKRVVAGRKCSQYKLKVSK